jgi:hypothetical protein
VPWSQPWPDEAAAARRFARIQLLIQLPGIPIVAAAIVYFLGFSRRPHHVVLAAIVASAFIVAVAVCGAWLPYRIRKTQAIARSQARTGNREP